MNTLKSTDTLVALDIGTSKVLCLVADIDDKGELRIIGIGNEPCSGLNKGVISEIDATVSSVRRAKEKASSMSSCNIESVTTGIAGNHIRSLNSHGIVGIKDKEVEASDIDRVIEAAQAVAIPSDQRVLHVLPQEYVIDNQDSIREPLGMSGVRLESHVHLVTCANNAIQNIEKCVKRCGIGVDGFVLEQLASSYSVLSEDEKELGVCLVDIGGGTTDIAVFNSGSISFTGVIPIAGDQVTSDIAVALRTPTAQAEDIKQKHGCAAAELTQDGETLEVMRVGGRPPEDLARRSLAEIIEPRYVELFDLVKAEIKRNGFENKIPAGIVLTGGTSKMEGAVALAESIFQTSVRLGIPEKFNGMEPVLKNPIYATAIGLIGFGFDQIKQGYTLENNKSFFDRAFGFLKNNY